MFFLATRINALESSSISGWLEPVSGQSHRALAKYYIDRPRDLLYRTRSVALPFNSSAFQVTKQANLILFWLTKVLVRSWNPF